MNHLIVFPIVLPAIAAAFILILGSAQSVVRTVSLASSLGILVSAAALTISASHGGYQVYALGDWVAPFGIVMVLDRLSAMLVLITAVVAFFALIAAIRGWDQKGKHFHALFHFQLMGINGAFLTGDLFNLFVFFEVLLIASYCLLLHGLGQERLKAAVHVVIINLTGSAVFLIAVSLLYSVTGTLNMAHLAERVATANPADAALIRSAGLMLIGVFGVKAALVPLYFWLPKAYASASAPVAALFAVMTKVGVYAIFRFTTLIFGQDQGVGASITEGWLLPVALITLILGSVGALAAQHMKTLVAYLTIASVGTMLTAFAAGGSEGLASGLFYLLHSTLVVAAMFLIADLISQERGSFADRLEPGPALRRPAVLGIIFMLGAAVLAGLPLSSGFLAKLMILKSVVDPSAMPWVWGVVLAASLISLIGLTRAGSMLIWNSAKAEPAPQARTTQPMDLAIPGALLACSLLMVVFASPIKHFLDQTAAQIYSPAGYVQATLPATVDRAPRRMQWSAKP